MPPIIRAQAPHRSQLFVPVVAKDRMIGGFAVVWWERQRDVGPSDLALLEAIANMAQGSDMHHTAQRTGSRIAALCRAEQQRQLKRYDAQLSRVASGVMAAPAPRKATNAEVAEWAERHDLRGSATDLRAAFEDAASLHLTYGVDLPAEDSGDGR